eukprot:1494703-Alexandrium_andersonii.AAC.1
MRRPSTSASAKPWTRTARTVGLSGPQSHPHGMAADTQLFAKGLLGAAVMLNLWMEASPRSA